MQLEAGRLAVTERASLMDRRQSFLVETTLTGHSEIRLMRDAQVAGYKVTLVYVGLNRADVSGTRVALRVRQGGHDVPREAILRRFDRSAANLAIAAEAADRVFVLDNTGARPRLLVSAETGRRPRSAGDVPAWFARLLPAIRLPGS